MKVIDTKGGIVTFNSACKLLSGYHEEEVQGRLFHEVSFLPEETKQDGAVSAALRLGHAPLRFRNHWRTRDGDSRLIEWSNTVLRNDVGISTHIIGTGTDVTNLKKTT